MRKVFTQVWEGLPLSNLGEDGLATIGPPAGHNRLLAVIPVGGLARVGRNTGYYQWIGLRV